MKCQLDGKIALVTGASSGIGALTARLLADRGAIPVLLARSEEKLKLVAATIRGPHETIVTDVRSNEEVAAAVRTVLARFGRIDILLNNAGYGVFEALTEARLETIEDMMNVNYFGTVRFTKAVLPHMLNAGEGHIVNVASMAGKIGSPKASAYSATKHAVLGFTNSLRYELYGTGVMVTSINPGPIDTPFFDTADPDGGYAKRVRWFMLKPERVAEAIVRAIIRRKAEVNMPFLASAGIKLVQLFPRLSDRAAGKLLNRK